MKESRGQENKTCRQPSGPETSTILPWTPSGSTKANKFLIHLDFLTLHNLKRLWHVRLLKQMKIQREHSPWFTAITSLLLKISKVSVVMFLTSHPIKRGAWHLSSSLWACDGLQTQHECNLNDNQEETNRNWSTFIKAHMLKWALYSWRVMPPLPTSNMSGSAQSDKIENKQDNSQLWFLPFTAI